MAQLDIDIDNFTHTYYHQEKRNKKHSLQGKYYRIYFEKCIEKQYERLYVMIKELYRERGAIDAEFLIKEYLKSIFARWENEEQMLPNKYCINLDGEFLNAMINSQTGSRTEHRLEDSIYEKRRRIQELAERYNIKDDFCM